jgi:hypothetical protein
MTRDWIAHVKKRRSGAGLHVGPDTLNRNHTSFGLSHRQRCVIVAVRAEGCISTPDNRRVGRPEFGR